MSKAIISPYIANNLIINVVDRYQSAAAWEQEALDKYENEFDLIGVLNEIYAELAAARQQEASAGGGAEAVIGGAAALNYVVPAPSLENTRIPPAYELFAENAALFLGAALPPAYEG